MTQQVKLKYQTTGGAIAALYVVLTSISAMMGLSSGVIQFRISECLCILPAFTPAAIPGLAIGCFLSNMIAGGVIWDMIFGSLATLIGAVGTYLLRKHPRLIILPPIISNATIVPLILRYIYNIGDAYLYLMLTTGIGEIVCVGFLGRFLYKILNTNRSIFM